MQSDSALHQQDDIIAAQRVLGALKWVYLPRKREGESSVGLTYQKEKRWRDKDFAACDFDHINDHNEPDCGTLLELDQRVLNPALYACRQLMIV